MTRMGKILTSNLTRLAYVAVLAVLLAGCESGTPTMAQVDSTTGMSSAGNGVSQTTNTAVEGQEQVQGMAPLNLDEAGEPVHLSISAANIDVPVIPMGWRIVTVNGERTTVWDVPEDSVGWHVNSAGAGAAGNVILSGRQFGGSAVFAPLALNAIEVGAQVLLTDTKGITFVYEISAISDPIPIAGASAEDQAQSERHFGQDGEAKLTLATGWPEFTTTHRIFVTAEFRGMQQ